MDIESIDKPFPAYCCSYQAISGSGQRIKMAVPVTGIQMSLVRLELPAASLRLVSNVSPGKIVGADVCDFMGQNCGKSSEAMVDTRYLHVKVENVGFLDSDLVISVSVSIP